MRIRLRFSKTGPIRFVGHLDFMRSFQKYIKKSGLMACYSAGFSPHMLMSFALPCAIGDETEGDYVDVDFAYQDTAPLTEQEAYRLTDMGLENASLPMPPHSEEFCRILNGHMPPGVCITDAVRVGLIKGSKAMALVRYASYVIDPVDDSAAGWYDGEELAAFSARDSIVIRKVTKSGEKDVDIRPQIVSLSAEDGRILLCCAAGSMENLKPLTVLKAYADLYGRDFDPYSFHVMRTDLYDSNMQTLLSLGTPF